MKVLITGSSGFVGKNFVKAMRGHDLTLIDVKEGHDAIDFFRQDNTQFDLVIHLAATVGGRKTIELAAHRLFNNIVLDCEMISWALKTKPGRIVYYSSSAAYPMSLQTKNSYTLLMESDINLDNVKNPDPSIYGWAKLTGEQVIRYSGLDNVYIFRPFSGYAEDQDLDYPFPAFIQRALRKEDPFEIWGDGEQVRDWIHIDDIIQGTLTILAHAKPGIYNLCTGRPVSFNEFERILTGMVGYAPEVKHILTAPVGVQYRTGDPTKMQKYYMPKITLEDGILRALGS